MKNSKTSAAATPATPKTKTPKPKAKKGIGEDLIMFKPRKNFCWLGPGLLLIAVMFLTACKDGPETWFPNDARNIEGVWQNVQHPDWIYTFGDGRSLHRIIDKTTAGEAYRLEYAYETNADTIKMRNIFTTQPAADRQWIAYFPDENTATVTELGNTFTPIFHLKRM